MFAFSYFCRYTDERMFVRRTMEPDPKAITPTRQAIIDFIVASMREHGFPPSIREIGANVGLTSSATVQRHVQILKEAGWLHMNPNQPRTMTVHGMARTPATSGNRSIPLIGDVAAGTGVLAVETVHDEMSLPEEFTGRGDSFVLQVRGESMIEAGILPGDYVVVARQDTAQKGDIVVAGIPGEEATVKHFFPQGSQVVLKPANSTMAPMAFTADEVTIYGRVISVLRRY
jgi:repressor LexA